MDELPEPARSIDGDYPTLYTRLVRRSDGDLEVDVVEFAGHRGRLPDSAHDCDGWLVGGSRRSVYEDEPWIRDAEGFVRAAAAAERPIVGICFGHQLVAQALGGTVELAATGWGLGAREYAVVSPTPWIDAPSVTLIASHQDQVTALPPDGRVWAVGAECPIAGMTIGDHVWTIQGHPEFTPELAAELYAGRTAAVGPDAVAAARSSLRRPLSNDAIGRAIGAFVGRRAATVTPSRHHRH